MVVRQRCGETEHVIWLVLGGLIMIGGIIWTLVGLVLSQCCVPEIGQACRRIGRFCFDPFTKALQWESRGSDGDPCCRCQGLCDFLWCITLGTVFCTFHVICAVLCIPLDCCNLCCCQHGFFLCRTHLQLAWIALYPGTMKLDNVDVDEGSLNRALAGSSYHTLPKL